MRRYKLAFNLIVTLYSNNFAIASEEEEESFKDKLIQIKKNTFQEEQFVKIDFPQIDKTKLKEAIEEIKSISYLMRDFFFRHINQDVTITSKFKTFESDLLKALEKYELELGSECYKKHIEHIHFEILSPYIHYTLLKELFFEPGKEREFYVYMLRYEKKIGFDFYKKLAAELSSSK